jgi:SH3-like domain-containing protein
MRRGIIKYLTSFLIFVLFLTFSCIFIYSDVNEAGYINADKVNFREEPVLESAIIEKLDTGTTVVILNEKNGWYNIVCNGKEGWVYKPYISIKRTVNVLEAKGKVNAQGVNIRKSASLDAATITKLNKGVFVDITGETKSWYRISYDDDEAFIYKEFVSMGSEYAGTGIITAEGVNLRDKADEHSNIIGKLKKDEKIYILVNFGNWYKVIANDKTGWVSSEYVNTDNLTDIWGYLTGDKVNLRNDPDLSSKIITKIKINTQIKIYCRLGEWYRISVNDSYGWLHCEYARIDYSMSERGYIKDIYPDVESREVSSKIKELISFSKKFLGVKYVWGGESPRGFDCSGFVKYVYKHVGISLLHKASLQSKRGIKIAKKDMQPGDLVFFEITAERAGLDHVGIYIGNNQFIHASASRISGRFVKISVIDKGFYSETFRLAKRLIND